MQIDAGGDGSFDEGFAHGVLAEDDQRDGSLDARAAARFFFHQIILSPCKRRLAHDSSLARRLDFPMVFGAASIQGSLPLLCRFPGPKAQMLAERGVLVEWFSPVWRCAGVRQGLKVSLPGDEKGSL